MTTINWNGPSSGDFFDPANWSDGAVPQGHPCDHTFIGGTADQRSVVVANQVAYNQIHSLTIGDYGTLKVTTPPAAGVSGDVFSVYSLEIMPTGELIIDTSAKVELGLAAQNRGGTVTIKDNPGNVILDGNSLNGSGTFNLINSTLGSEAAPVRLDQQNVTLSGNSTLYADSDGTGASVTFDPATVNTLVLSARDASVTSSLNGFSENARIAINGDDGVSPSSVAFTQNTDGSYSAVISLSNGKTVTLSDIVAEDGYTPGSASWSQDAAGNWVITESNASTTTPSYADSDIHQQLQAVSAHADSVGSDVQASSGAYSQHSAAATDNFIGTGTAENPAQWSDPSNWSLGVVPQDSACYHASLSGTADSPIYVEASQADVAQFMSLSIFSNATLTIDAPVGENPSSYAFATAGLEIRGNGVLNIDTPAKVELGGVSQIEGTINITGNDGNVILDSSRLNGDGTLNLIDSTLGSADHPVYVGLNVNLYDSSTFYASLYGLTNTITFADTTSNTVVLDDSASQIGVHFENVNANSHFAINTDAGVKPVSVSFTKNDAPAISGRSLVSDPDSSAYTMVITLDNGQQITLSHVHMAQGYAPGSTVTITQDAVGDWVINLSTTDVCFLAGTLIRTVRGDVAVEDLAIGDELVVVGGAEGETRPVTWIGENRVSVRSDSDETEAGYPVRILRGALAENVPSRDLLVTAEHCLFVNGGFTPARMLVNGSSVFYDRSIETYSYFHVETERHSVILAENLPTESYLDTGNRRSFVGGRVVSLVSRQLTWADAAAPLMTQRSEVEAVHARLARRAQDVLGLKPVARAALTRKSGLVFETVDGRVLRRLGETAGVVTVELPEDVSVIRLRSLANRPSDVIGPFVDDRRQLGVLVADVVLQDGATRHEVTAHLHGQAGAGWHVPEGSACWTNGDAFLDLGARVPGTKGLLRVRIAAAGPYLVRDTEAGFARCA